MWIILWGRIICFIPVFLIFLPHQKEVDISVGQLGLHQPLWLISSDVSKDNITALFRLLYSFMIRF